jgi:cellulose synthase/poly-beta-1,6-N-acetylglucosamine synthase-like glycosyltransferase
LNHTIFLFFTWISLLLAGFYVYVIVRYIGGWNEMPAWEIPPLFQPSTKVSVLIPARNEEENIAACLGSVGRQSYPEALFEVIVIDDHSTDATPLEVEKFASRHGNVRLLKLADYVEPGTTQSFKKKAIETGVFQASGELVVTTDADCLVQENWLALLVSFYEKHGWQFIAAPVNFHREKNLFERFQSLDFMGMMCGTGAGIHLRIKNMCNGANLAYPKAAFLEVGGFEGIDHLATGDDILLMQKIAACHPGKVGFLKNAAATVYSEAKPTVSSFVSQRVRWASKSTAYKEWQVTVILGLVFLYCCAIVFSLALVPWWGWQALLLTGLLFLVKTVTDYYFLGMMARFFSRQDLMKSYLASQFLHIAYIVVVGVLGNTVRRYEWKGRRVR